MTDIPNSVLNQYLGCTDCMGTILVSEAFKIASMSWPKNMWIAYHCPNCDNVNHLALKSNTITEGYISGDLDPCLVPLRTIDIPNLSVVAKRESICIKTLNLSWNIPASS